MYCLSDSVIFSDLFQAYSPVPFVVPGMNNSESMHPSVHLSPPYLNRLRVPQDQYYPQRQQSAPKHMQMAKIDESLSTDMAGLRIRKRSSELNLPSAMHHVDIPNRKKKSYSDDPRKRGISQRGNNFLIFNLILIAASGRTNSRDSQAGERDRSPSDLDLDSLRLDSYDLPEALGSSPPSYHPYSHIFPPIVPLSRSSTPGASAPSSPFISDTELSHKLSSPSYGLFLNIGQQNLTFFQS